MKKSRSQNYLFTCAKIVVFNGGTMLSISALSLAVALHSGAASGKIAPDVELAARDGARVVVALRRPSSAARDVSALARQTRRIQKQVLRRVRGPDFRLIRRFETISALSCEVGPAALEKLARDPDVIRVDLDVGGQGAMVESLPLIGADKVQAQLGLTGAGTTIAVVDSGVRADHPDLVGRLVDEHCFCDNGDDTGCCPNGQVEQSGPGSAIDDNGHGTNVAGIVVSAGGVAPIGVAPAAEYISVKVLNSNNGYNSATQVIAALDWLIVNHPELDAVNMSLGSLILFPMECDDEASWTLAFSQAIETLTNNGTAVVVSSGNGESLTSMGAPACIANSIAVGAVYDSDLGSLGTPFCTDDDALVDEVTCFSNSSPALDLLAPGALITSTGAFSDTSEYFGTSQAAPQVAGALLLLEQYSPGESVEDRLSLLQETGVLITDDRNERVTPRIDVFAALSPEICDDGNDNDHDDDVDCADSNCDGEMGPEGQTCEPGGEATCDDALDNDGDNTLDCLDPNCDGLPGPDGQICEPGGELTCNDSLDNDGDDAVDCADPDCDGAQGAGGQVCEPDGELTCDDMLDNDGDTQIDCDDMDCSTAPMCQPEICDDGVDNDVDGSTDCDDSECAESVTCQSELCTDNQDNNADGLVDCEDPMCAEQPVCQDSQGTEDTTTTCGETGTAGAEACQDDGCGCHQRGDDPVPLGVLLALGGLVLVRRRP